MGVGVGMGEGSCHVTDRVIAGVPSIRHQHRLRRLPLRLESQAAEAEEAEAEVL